ncbi:C13 family peptidase [Desulfoferrobacter suflitae]|uniref:C13 family peptidase n=1 Tax=Desulfoferrobacter suflitae TaxID=2865782 RepID=UPI002164E100|nr:C13 family peptidase [Desulfoferrobacter suflitae]MCK8604036.1 C13 family peptidase [Desulfoferrobacter suflitae]
MGTIKNPRIRCLLLLLFVAPLYISPICHAQINSLQFAYDKLVAEVLGDDLAGREVFGDPQAADGLVVIETTEGPVRLGEGPGWIFFIEDTLSEHPLHQVVLVSPSGAVVGKVTKGRPLSLSSYLTMTRLTSTNFASATAVESLPMAYQRLIDGLLGHTVGNRKIYAIAGRLEGEVAVENWRERLILGDGPGWVFFLDDNPPANWEHACRFVLVKESGEILVTPSMTPPKTMSLFREMPSLPASQLEGNSIDVPKGSLSPPDLTARVNILPKEVGTPPANRWAVIISGGFNAWSNHVRYWNDCSYFYRTLTAHGFQDDHIYVLMSDGTDPSADRSDGTDSPLDLDGDGDPDIRFSATKANITKVFNSLRSRLGADDILYIFATDHGGSNDVSPYANPTVILYLWGETITDAEFAAEVNKVTAGATVCIFEQCFSGGMIDDLQAPNRVLISAARFWELSYAMAPTYEYDEFSYHFTYAAANPAGGDADGDGVVSMEEAYLYALAHDSRQSEEMDYYDDNLGEHPSYYSDPWDLGRRVSFSGLAQEVADTALSGYTQVEVEESFPTGGVAQGWSGDDAAWEYPLPFTFPYYGKRYTRVAVDANGLIYLGAREDPTYQNSVDGLKAKQAIAPLWDDLTVLKADGDAVYISQQPHGVTIRWAAHTYRDRRPVNVAVQLSSSGVIRFLYGDGNEHTGRIAQRDKTIGISNGDGSRSHLCLRNGQWGLGDAAGIQYTPVPTPMALPGVAPGVLHLLLSD